jgi:uncharacterized membrane protein
LIVEADVRRYKKSVKRVLKILMGLVSVIYGIALILALAVGTASFSQAGSASPTPFVGTFLAAGFLYVCTMAYMGIMLFLAVLLIAFSLASPPQQHGKAKKKKKHPGRSHGSRSRTLAKA